MRPPAEIIVPFPAPLARLALPTRVRSTLIVSSLRSLQVRGLDSVYAARVDPAWREVLRQAVAGTWLPIAAGVAHYRACDSAVPTATDQIAIGREVGDRLHATFLGTMIRAATGAGITPWVVFAYAQKFYDRLFDGGGCCATKLGPKDAQLEMAQNPLIEISYFRNAARGLWMSALELFCTKAYARETARTESSFSVKISWA
jgi:hypothetical protein